MTNQRFLMDTENEKQVKALYMEKPDLLIHRAKITKIGFGEINKKKYHWIELDETIFHPKGGGQPSDEGRINGIKVAYVHKEVPDKSRFDQFHILHCFDEHKEISFSIGQEVSLAVDAGIRKQHSKLHTAGHMVAEAVHQHFPSLVGYQGNHYPQDSYVKFKSSISDFNYDKELLKQKVQDELRIWVERDLPVDEIKQPDGTRCIKITQDWSPCGGTHIQSLKEIGLVEISDVSINKKENTITVKYKLPSYAVI